MEAFRISYLWLSLLSFSYGQHMKTPPGVPPEKYGMYAAQDMGMHHAQMQPHQVPVQQQQVPVQMQQVPMQQVPMQHQQMHMQQQQVPMQQQQVPMQQQQVPMQMQQVPVQMQQQHVPHGAHPPQQILNAAHMAQEKEYAIFLVLMKFGIYALNHIREHMEVPIDTSKMSDQELQFHYFKMHDADNNNKLDGCELIKSLIHWHEQGHSDPNHAVPQEKGKVFSDEELVSLIDPILSMDDANNDGFIDYPEFVKAQQKAAAAGGQNKESPQKHEPSGEKNEEKAHYEILSDEVLSQVIDPILVKSDKNNDGFLDYPEYEFHHGDIALKPIKMLAEVPMQQMTPAQHNQTDTPLST
ncbi:hypothetical protein J437_LFUL004514 [Ladona fulva]|uniref:EF-hand domain-containing protein n=1 Tax=Ladona fulva TaxID=123851 RepID=A0A8K0P1Z7_LADFU|nr:hypothetical protein J437_LFUL004514 [Ladona fulva]